MKYYSIIPILMSAMLLSACGGGGSDDDGDNPSSTTTTPDSTQPPAEVKPPPVANDLQGKWKRYCFYDSKIDAYRKQTYVFSGNEYDYSSLFYKDSNCYDISNAYAEVVQSGTYLVGKLITTSTGLKAYNLTFKVELENGESVSYISEQIYKVDGNILYLGRDGGNTLDLNNPYYK